MKDKKYILITKDLHKSLIDFLDEVQFDIAANTDKDSMHKVNFISWAIGELVNTSEMKKRNYFLVLSRWF